ncbi:MAG: TIGR03086 family metal-binding protein [Actinomycetota bacterium]|nr:TIGR03086 family metal-binding protein [Actinomycetota bacterium]
MDAAELHRRAVEGFGELVGMVGENQWHSPTPDQEWDVRDLVNHLVVENRWTRPLMTGMTIEEVGDRFEGDLLGDDPRRAWQESATEALEAMRAEGAMTRTVHISAGDVTGEEYALQLFSEHLIHGWDLAQAIGAPDRLDPELVRAAAAWFASKEEEYRQAGAIGRRPEIPADADEQWVLLAMFGRRAGG